LLLCQRAFRQQYQAIPSGEVGQNLHGARHRLDLFAHQVVGQRADGGSFGVGGRPCLHAFEGEANVVLPQGVVGVEYQDPVVDRRGKRSVMITHDVEHKETGESISARRPGVQIPVTLCVYG
jgi:hypothetical protein